MVTILLLSREGEINEIAIDDNKLKNLVFNRFLKYKYLDIIELNKTSIDGYYYIVYGSDNNYILKENKHELFYPLNQRIYYGDLIILKLDNNNNILDFKIEDFKIL